MPPTFDLFYLAAAYHRALPERIRAYLRDRGIPDSTINLRFLGWNGTRITIPIFKRRGVCASFRLAKDPNDPTDSPKMLSSRGTSVELYGWEVVRLRPKKLVICEGEFDRLVLESNGFYAVTSTGGAGTVREEWAQALKDVPEIYVCLDRDDAGWRGALRVAGMLPQSKIVELPPEVGEGGDVTDFFVRLHKTRDDFGELLKQAKPAPQCVRPSPLVRKSIGGAKEAGRERIEKIKRLVPIERVVAKYIELRKSGKTFVGVCPFHDDHKPSLVVYPATGSFHCFGCSAHGDALSFIQELQRLNFAHALEALERIQSNEEGK